MCCNHYYSENLTTTLQRGTLTIQCYPDSLLEIFQELFLTELKLFREVE